MLLDGGREWEVNVYACVTVPLDIFIETVGSSSSANAVNGLMLHLRWFNLRIFKIGHM